MIKLYGLAYSRAARCVWMLEELGVEYELIPVDTHGGESKQPDYLALNPNGRVPTLVDGDMVLWESMAINLHLARTYDSALAPTSEADWALCVQWSFWAVNEVEWALLDYGQHMHFFAEAERRADVAEAARQQLHGAFGVLEEALDRRSVLVGERFTVGDLNTAAVLRWAPQMGLDISPWPRVRNWLLAATTRPAAIRSHAPFPGALGSQF